MTIGCSDGAITSVSNLLPGQLGWERGFNENERAHRRPSVAVFRGWFRATSDPLLILCCPCVCRWPDKLLML